MSLSVHRDLRLPCLALALLTCGPSAASWLDEDLTASLASFVGEESWDWAGYAVAGVGDLDHDGINDLLIGAPVANCTDATGNKEQSGALYLFYGREEGWQQGLELADADACFCGSGAGNHAGNSFTVVSFLAQEPALLIGAMDNDWGGIGTGEAVLLPAGEIAPGPSPCQDLGVAGYHLVGSGTNAHAGTAVASAGDLDGDGWDELLIGEPGAGGEQGRAYLLQSGVIPDLYTQLANVHTAFYATPGDGVGTALASAGDVNGDLRDDFLIGAPGNDAAGDDAGAAYLILGHRLDEYLAAGPADLGEIQTAVFVGEYEGDQAGVAVAGAGDLDGNGHDDFVIGAPGYDGGSADTGAVYLRLGHGDDPNETVSLATSPMIFVGHGAGDLTGNAMAGVGDVNGDGLDDLLVGAPGTSGHGAGTGTAFLLLGMVGGQRETVDITVAAAATYGGEQASDLAGFSLARLGDVNGDGMDDFAVGAPGNDEGGGLPNEPLDGAGKVYVVAGTAAQDLDGDGFYGTAGGGDDCDDDDPNIHPEADEICDDGADNDCDGNIDGEDSECDEMMGDDDDTDAAMPGAYTGGGFICAAARGDKTPTGWLVPLAALICALGCRRSTRRAVRELRRP